MNAADVTWLLNEIRRGATEATDRLIAAVYAELRQIAENKLRGERAGHTLQPTALVNEAFLRLVENQDQLQDRSHFFGAAAKAMERVLVDHARQKLAQKRGGAMQRVTLHEINVESTAPDLNVLETHEAITALELESPDLATTVRQRYFLGLTLEQIADVEGVSLATVKRRWTFAKAWLFDRLEG